MLTLDRSHGKGTIPFHWEIECCHKRHSTHTSLLQGNLGKALLWGNQDYEVECTLSTSTRQELEWWITYLSQWNGKSMLKYKPTMSLETDAFLKGWGGGGGGGNMQRSPDWRSVVHRETVLAHKLPGQQLMLAIQCFAQDK